MSAGAPWVSKNTLCATPAKSNFTVSPTLMLSELGVNARLAVALTIPGAGGGGGGGGGGSFLLPYGPVDPPQAASATINEALMMRVMRDMEIILSEWCK